MFYLQAHLYEDPSRWGLTLQTYVQLTMLEQHQKKTVKLLFCLIQKERERERGQCDFSFGVAT